MDASKTEHILSYLSKVKSANKELTKKELFKDLLNRLYAHNPEILKIIDAISSGAETPIINIPRNNKKHRGSADTLYNKIIIEFENGLKSSFTHAKQQLAGYLLGQFNVDEGYNFTLIVSDFINWKIVVPDISQLETLETLQEHELILNEAKDSSFTLTQENAEEFYYWIDRFLFKEEKQKATLKRIEEAFGYNSPTFIESFRQITSVFNDAKKFGEVQVSYEQWRKFLSIAYGNFEGTSESFAIHTYLSVLAKLIAYEVLSNDEFIDDNEIKTIVDGSIFFKYNIGNFVDNDFFHWVHKDRYFDKLKKTIRKIAHELSKFDFNNVDEDILKGVYQELVDLDTRHTLGEYYTPDWLCERIVNEFDFKPTDKILDPSCGSGSFLRASIHRLKKLHPNLSAEQINNCIYGIDIHPLSVQIAKTTVLLSLGKNLSQQKKILHLNIILANTLLAPDGVQDLFGKTFKMSIDKQQLILTSQILDDITLFDDGLAVCEKLAEQSQNKKQITIQQLETNIRRYHKNGGLSPNVLDSFYKIYEGFKKVKEKGRDSIWKFILQNLYKPYFLSGKFNYVIGNPPWFTYSNIKNEEYQTILDELAIKYNVKPTKVADFPHLEIAAIFLAYCSGYFLKETGKIAFVLPRSFFNGNQHDNTRSGKSLGFKLTSIWDLNDVSPLFRVPSAVLFAENNTNGKSKSISSTGLNGLSISGKVPSHNCKLAQTKNKLIEEDVIWHYSKQGNSSAFSTKKLKLNSKINPYKKLFKQGATLVPRTFYFVEKVSAFKDDVNEKFDWKDRNINIRTSKNVLPDAKMPWKKIELKGLIESDYIFRTALSKSILPFVLYQPDLVVLPIQIALKNKIKNIELLETKSIQLMYANKWFTSCDSIWKIHRTEKSKKMSANDRIDFQKGLTYQNLNAPYLVLYNASAKDANATIVKRKDLDLEFIVESTAYVFYTSNLKEAYYLTAILNSKIPNLMMKDFQAKGLFGPRHVHKKILDIYYPKFDEINKIHLQLSEISKTAHSKALAYLKYNAPKQQLSAIHLGKTRTEIKKYLIDEMIEIDKLVKKIIS